MKSEKIKKILLYVSLIIGLSGIPILVGYLFSIGFDRPVIFETVPALFALIYLMWILFQVGRKDNLLYRKGKYKSKEDYKSSEDYQRYKRNQLLLLIPVVLLVVSSLFIFFFYVKK